MQGKICLAALAALWFGFLSQPAAAEDDNGECADAITSNIGNYSAMEKMGIHPYIADVLAGGHQEMVETFAKLVQLQQSLDNLDLIEPVFSGKNAGMQKVFDKVRENIRAQMDSLREQLNRDADVITKVAVQMCNEAHEEDAQDERHKKHSTAVDIGLGLGVDLSGDDDHHHHRHRHHHKGCAVQQ